MIHIDDVILAPVAEPEIPLPAHLPELPDETYALRLELTRKGLNPSGLPT